MAWRIIAQPNGRLARFSEIVDDVTDYDMTREEAVNLCMREHHMSRQDAESKVQRGIDAGQSRFEEAIRTIADQHGKARAQARWRMMARLRWEGESK